MSGDSHGRTGRLLEDGTHGPFHSVRCQQVLGGKDARQDCGVGRKEERRADTQDKGTRCDVPQLEQARHGESADGRYHSEVGALHGNDQPALGDPIGSDAAGQDERHQAHAAGCGHQGQFQRAAAQMDHLVDHGHGPHAGTKD